MRIREHIASSVFFVCSSAGIFSKIHYLVALGVLATFFFDAFYETLSSDIHEFATVEEPCALWLKEW